VSRIYSSLDLDDYHVHTGSTTLVHLFANRGDVRPKMHTGAM